MSELIGSGEAPASFATLDVSPRSSSNVSRTPPDVVMMSSRVMSLDEASLVGVAEGEEERTPDGSPPPPPPKRAGQSVRAARRSGARKGGGRRGGGGGDIGGGDARAPVQGGLTTAELLGLASGPSAPSAFPANGGASPRLTTRVTRKVVGGTY